MVGLHQKSDPVVLSVAFFGCNRLDGSVWKGHERDNPSSANLPQLRQSLMDIGRIQPKPKLVFAVGDLVMNYVNDQGQALHRQLDSWARQVLGVTTIPIVPVAGNHELNKKVGNAKLPNPATDAVWNQWLTRSGFAHFEGNGPSPEAPGNPDFLVDDQSKLSYSFRLGRQYFIVINTDTRTYQLNKGTNTTRVGWIPVHWILSELDHAEKSPSIDNVFVLGHRNLFDPLDAKSGSPLDEDCARQLISALPRFAKVRAYLCAHLHAWDLSRIPGTAVWQVVSGHGGSPPEDSWHPAGGITFGFAVVNVHKSGSVGITAFHRPVNKNQIDGDGEGVVPASADHEVFIYRPMRHWTLSAKSRQTGWW